jgi:drug/metabolite transporter (DMT)-like permease
MCKSDLSVPLVQPPQARGGKASIAGLLMVTSAALLFGVVAAFVKAASLPTLVMLQIRSLLEWLLGLIVAIGYYRHERGRRDMLVMSSTELMEGGALSMPAADGPLWKWLIGPPHLWHWLILRAFLYWGFLACWWLSLSSMPIGDATTIVYTAPIWTATFAFYLLGERIDWTFYPILLLDVCGVVLITQPSFIFGDVARLVPDGAGSNGTSTSGGRTSEDSYLLGTLCALSSAFIAGLLPVCTRKSKEAVWIVVNQVSDALSAFVFTPLAFVVWFSVDSSAEIQCRAAAAALFTGSHPAGSTFDGTGKWLLLLGATFTGFAGLALQTLGYQREEAAKASVMTILEIPFAYLLQNAIFHDEITPLGICGVGLVICGTALNLARHMQRAASEKQQVKDC